MAVRVGRRTPGPLSGGVDSDSTRGGGATDARGVRTSWFGTHPRRVHARGVSARRGPGERAVDLRAGACQTRRGRTLRCEVMLKDIVEVKPLGDYRLYLRFEDGVAGEVDFAGRLRLQGGFAP